MEQGRLFLAIVLSFLVFVVWEFVFVDKQEKLPPTGLEKSIESPETQPVLNDAGSPEALPADALGVKALAQGTGFNTLSINTPLYSATISEKNAAIVGFVLHDYKERMEAGSPNKELISENNPSGTAILGFTDKDASGISTAVFKTDVTDKSINVKDAVQSVSFFWQSDAGILVEKKYSFYPDTYKIKLEVVIKNLSAQAFDDDLTLSLINAAPGGKQQFSFEGPFAFINEKLEEVPIKDLDEKNTLTGTVGWAGLGEQYFMAVVIPEKSSASTVLLKQHLETKLLEVQYVQETPSLQPSAQESFDFSLYLGPKRMSALKAAGGNLDHAINFGFFDVIAKPCLWLMNTIHDRWIPNYGVAIILLTIMFKIIFWPLGSKSYKSMAEMKKLTPLMTEIREKYKNDKKKMNEEVMALYKTYKVNPMSGCLPMIVQIPVFFAFYRMLYGSIELRHAPFIGWITDLSAPDRLFSFDIVIPLMTPPYGIPVLTIIMGATMFLQQKLSPPPGDPAQARMMMLMPLIFTFIFINFPAGLVLYWLVNNVLSISQQYYITKKTV
ncbi:MAG: membrane protein insertase YidC [Desulfosalsimonadaceae bacterium]